MTLSTEAATLRAALMVQLRRTGARSHMGGPFIVWRDGSLLVFDERHTELVVTEQMVAALERLTDEAGVEAVWRAIEEAKDILEMKQ